MLITLGLCPLKIEITYSSLIVYTVASAMAENISSINSHPTRSLQDCYTITTYVLRVVSIFLWILIHFSLMILLRNLEMVLIIPWCHLNQPEKYSHTAVVGGRAIPAQDSWPWSSQLFRGHIVSVINGAT